jgi:hypothetical protein
MGYCGFSITRFDEAPVVLEHYEVASDGLDRRLILDRQYAAYVVLPEHRHHAAEVFVHEEDIAQEEHEGAVDEILELGQGVRDAERWALVDELDLHAQIASVSEGAHDLEPQVADDDDHPADADIVHALDLMLQERLTQDGKNRFRVPFAEGMKPRPFSGGEDHAEQGRVGAAHGARIIPAW